MTSETTLLCAICGDATDDPRLLSECMSCDRTFHLNPYNNKEHRDCGDAIIGPTQGVEFWCQLCLEELNAELSASQPDPRAMLDQLAGPAELRGLVQRPAPVAPPAAVPAPPAPPAPATSNAPSDQPPAAPPPRRDRAEPRKRYRRIDG
jgi:hypothetical protein